MKGEVQRRRKGVEEREVEGNEGKGGRGEGCREGE